VNQLLKAVIDQIKPGEEEAKKIEDLAMELMNKANSLSNKKFDSLIVGSVAKKTFLKGADIDLFLKFNTDTDLKKEGLDIAKKILPNGRELYAQHPYLRGEIKGIGIDVVPCYSIENSTKSISAVDRTPFHTEWVKNNISGMEDDIRLTKQFLKGCGAYGASSAVGGFSGYLVEILCIKYGGFEKLVNEIANWKPPIIFDNVENAPNSPIMLADPVDYKRNVAAGVTLKGLGSAVLASKAFLAEPSLDFFFPKNKKRPFQGFVTTAILPHPGGNEETALPWLQRQGRKIYNAISDFEPIAWNVNLEEKGYLVFETASIELPSIIPHKGPAPWDDGAMDFLKKYPDSSLNEDRLETGKAPRKATIAEVILELLPKAEIKKGLAKGAQPIQRVPWLD
jgi:tRNA nucleotidyltransferase (CCA-adding enzyme)